MTTTRRLAAACLAFAAVSSVTTSIGVAWEENVHRQLTFWLAAQAGFSEADAATIAAGTQSLDDSSYDSAIPTVVWLVLSGDVGAARGVRDKHFPSDGPVPGEPLVRRVQPGSQAARREVEAILSGSTLEPDLFRFGQALHPLQDSWSHQGIPDPPFDLRPQLAVGHPEDRGGWWRHHADHSYRHQAEVVEVARATYSALDRLLDKYPSRRATPGVAFDLLEPSVRVFARARTATEERAWMESSFGFVPLGFRNDFRGDPQAFPSPTIVRIFGPPSGAGRELVQPFGLADTQRDVPGELVNAASRFLNLWYGEHAIQQAAQEFVDWSALAEQFGPTGLLQEAEDVVAWCERFMTLLVALDHSAANELGHGDPADPRYGELPRVPPSDGPFQAGPSTAVNIRPTQFIPLEAGGTGEFALVLSSSLSPHDAICVVWRNLGTWRVVRMFAAVQ